MSQLRSQSAKTGTAGALTRPSAPRDPAPARLSGSALRPHRGVQAHGRRGGDIEGLGGPEHGNGDDGLRAPQGTHRRMG